MGSCENGAYKDITVSLGEMRLYSRLYSIGFVWAPCFQTNPIYAKIWGVKTNHNWIVHLVCLGMQLGTGTWCLNMTIKDIHIFRVDWSDCFFSNFWGICHRDFPSKPRWRDDATATDFGGFWDRSLDHGVPWNRNFGDRITKPRVGWSPTVERR